MKISRNFILSLLCILIFSQCILIKDFDKDKKSDREKQLLGLFLIYDFFSPFGIKQQRSAKYSATEVLLFGGNSQRSYSLSNVYKLTENQITYLGSMNKPRHQHEVVTLKNGKILIIGGYDGRFILSDSEIYDPANNSFTTVSSLNIPRTYHTATVLNDGRVLITGGFGKQSEKLKSAEIFNPSSNSFQLINDMNFSRRRHSATLLNNGNVLIVGGDGANETLSSAELFDPNTNTFTLVGQQMSVARSNHTANLLDNNRVVFSGGYSFDMNGNYFYSKSLEVFDFGTGNFSVIGNMAESRSAQGAVKVGTDVLICGGGRLENNIYTEPKDCYKVSNAGVLTKEPYSFITSRALFVFEQIGNSIIACGGENKFGQIRSCEANSTGNFSLLHSQL
ncbi:kelch repeat protein [Leptospira wolbachii serovar Codice str. CDC]|uniref:Kelch repeat protein n=1 Tax=Leptospira wolbachii serovar Codice str. CDC TaxID=1218599 RepID=R8ZZN0_9LEPT|nr:kelch repeat-containing protein [Leptospira wolbachii]EOQ95403.1 kelch repeat protein [Leptospira wolbachii serovar Codice str. CDC]